jgi:isoleucyl-tRNA synthetase
VKRVDVRATGEGLATVTCKANFKRLGRRYGKQMKQAAAAIEALSGADFATLESGGEVMVLDQPVTLDDVMVRREPAADVVLESEGALAVALETALSDDLLDEGAARELTSVVQRSRKDAGLEVTDRIALTVRSPDAVLRRAIEAHAERIAADVLATSLSVVEGEGDDVLSTVRGEHPVAVSIARA